MSRAGETRRPSPASMNTFASSVSVFFFDDLLQPALLCRDEPRHVAFHEERVADRADEAERRFPLEEVAHESAARDAVKFVNVAQSPERAASHLVDEAARPIEFDDLRGESLCQSKVLSFEGR